MVSKHVMHESEQSEKGTHCQHFMNFWPMYCKCTDLEAMETSV